MKEEEGREGGGRGGGMECSTVHTYTEVSSLEVTCWNKGVVKQTY